VFIGGKIMAVKKGTKKNLGGGQIGNKNAYKDDEEKVLKVLNDIINGLKDGRYYSLSKALLSNGIGYNSLKAYEKKYEKNEVVFDIIKNVRELGEVALECNGQSGDISPPMAMFNLKHHYGHTDQPQQADTTPPKFVFRIER
jgi:hypothetical protein